MLTVFHHRFDQTCRSALCVVILGLFGRGSLVLWSEHRLNDGAITLLVAPNAPTVLEPAGDDPLTRIVVPGGAGNPRQLVVLRSRPTKPGSRQDLLDLSGVRAACTLARSASPKLGEFRLAAELRSATPDSLTDIDDVVQLGLRDRLSILNGREIHRLPQSIPELKHWQTHRYHRPNGQPIRWSRRDRTGRPHTGQRVL